MYTAVHKGYGKRSESLSTDALHSIHKVLLSDLYAARDTPDNF